MNAREYLKRVIDKFNQNPNDAELSIFEKTILSKVVLSERLVSDAQAEIESIEKEIISKQQLLLKLNTTVSVEKARSNALLDALMAAKES